MTVEAVDEKDHEKCLLFEWKSLFSQTHHHQVPEERGKLVGTWLETLPDKHITSAPPTFLYVPKDNCSTNTRKWCDPLIGPKDYTPKNLGSILQFLLTYFCTFCKNCYDTDDTLKQHLSLHKMTQQMLKCIVDRHNSRRTRHISIIHAVVVEVNCIVSWLTTSQQCNQSQTVQLQLKTSVFLSTMTTKTKIFVDKK